MAAVDIGTILPTKIPGYGDPADIQAALKLYHYGQLTEPANVGSLPGASVAGYLTSLQGQINTINSVSYLTASTFNAKGDLLSASADNTLSILPVGSNGRVLSANSATTSGLQWIDFPSSFTNLTATSVTATGNIIGHIATVPKTGNYTPTAGDLSDDGKLIEFNSSSAHTYTIPTHANNPYLIGTQISILQINNGQTTITGASGVTLNCTPQPTTNVGRLRTVWSSATLIKRGENAWVLIGDLSAS
jgi:hypothetical protein